MTKTTKLVVAALCLALCVLLPMVFHAFGMMGPVFLPMHIPVLLCGLLCGPRLGLLCGLLGPILSGVLTPMPVLYPTGVAMAFELGTYGLISGWLAKKYNIYVALVCALLCGRAVSGLANTVLLGMLGNGYSLKAFLTAAFVTGLPGIAVQLVALPPLVLLVKKAFPNRA